MEMPPLVASGVGISSFTLENPLHWPPETATRVAVRLQNGRHESYQASQRLKRRQRHFIYERCLPDDTRIVTDHLELVLAVATDCGGTAMAMQKKKRLRRSKNPP